MSQESVQFLMLIINNELTMDVIDIKTII